MNPSHHHLRLFAEGALPNSRNPPSLLAQLPTDTEVAPPVCLYLGMNRGHR